MSSGTLPPGPPVLLPPDLLQGLKDIKVDKYLQVASTVLFLYDFLLTFPAEVRLIWGRKRSLTTLIFFWCRYSGFIDIVFITVYQEFTPILSIRTCKVLYNTKAWLSTGGTSLAEVILVLRTCAIWNGDRRIASLLFTFLAVAIAGACVFCQRFLLSLTYAPTPSASAFPGCFVEKAAEEFWGSYSFVVFFETVILSFTLFKVVYDARFQHSTIFRKMYKDGILFYVYDFMFSVVFIVTLALPSQIALTQGLTSFFRALHTILSSRLLLNIREAADISSRSGSSGPGLSVTSSEVQRSRSGLNGGFSASTTRIQDLNTIEMKPVST